MKRLSLALALLLPALGLQAEGDAPLGNVQIPKDCASCASAWDDYVNRLHADDALRESAQQAFDAVEAMTDKTSPEYQQANQRAMDLHERALASDKGVRQAGVKVQNELNVFVKQQQDLLAKVPDGDDDEEKNERLESQRAEIEAEIERAQHAQAEIAAYTGAHQERVAAAEQKFTAEVKVEQQAVAAAKKQEEKKKEEEKPKDAGQAKEYIDKQEEKDPTDSKTLGARAAANYSLGDMEAACADSKAALRADARNTQAFGISKLSCTGKMLESKDFGKTPKVFSTPLQDNLSGPEADPSASRAAAGPPVAGFTAAAYVPGQTADPRAAYDKAREAESLLYRGRYADGIAAAKRALALDPRNKAAYSLLAAAYKALRDFRSAANAAQAGLTLDPKNLALLLILADARAKLGDHAGAKAAAERALAENPTNATAYALLAHALGKTGDRQGMLDALRQAAALDPAFNEPLAYAKTVDLNADTLFYLPGEPRPAKAPAAPSDRPARRAMVRFAIFVMSAGVLFGLWQTLGPGFGIRPRPAAGAAPPEEAAAGEAGLLAGKYELRGEIGQGGMGFVYEGYDHKLDRRVAIKKMRPELKSDPAVWQQFLKEARIISHLSHPYIVAIHDLAEEAGETYLILDFVDGQTLHAALRQKKRFTLKECRALFAQVCPAVDFAHQKKILHRDLKPANIMLDTGGFAKVMDFGVAREAKESLSRLTSVDSSGTPAYMAPEQHMGMAGRQADVYSLAVCLYEMLTGQVPFPGPDFMAQKERLAYVPPTTLVPGLPRQADLLFKAAFTHDPLQRVASGAELLELLDSLPESA